MLNPTLSAIIEAQPYPLIFVTVSGAHLYGFPSPDSDYDLRGVHVLPVLEDGFAQGRMVAFELPSVRLQLLLDFRNVLWERRDLSLETR